VEVDFGRESCFALYHSLNFQTETRRSAGILVAPGDYPHRRIPYTGLGVYKSVVGHSQRYRRDWGPV